MSKIVDAHVELLIDALRNEPADTPLDKAVARLREPFVLGEGSGEQVQFHWDKIIVMMVAVREALHGIDPKVSPNLPPFLMDPVIVARTLNIPLDRFSYPGNTRLGVDRGIVNELRQMVERLEASTDMQPSPLLNDLEKDILQALGMDTLTGEEIAKRAKRNYDSTFKGALAGLRRRRILGNRNPGYYRL